MYMLIRIEDVSVLEKVRKYFKRLGYWLREFNEPEYHINVTAEERVERILVTRSGQLNPNAAWRTCASFVRAWDWDSLGRGPSPKSDYDLKRTHNAAPRGKGYVKVRGEDQRVAGECANPTMLHYISCPLWCPKYQPTSIEAAIYVAKQIASEHEQRAAALYRQIESLERCDKGYREAVEKGCVFDFRGETFAIPPTAKGR